MNEINSYCIFLENNMYSEQKLKETIDSGSKYGWKIIPFPGTRGDQVNWDDENLTPSLNKKFQIRIGSQGCFMSHYRLWKLCFELNQPIAIFEHDVLFQTELKNIDLTHDVIKLKRLSQFKDDEFTGKWEAGAYGYIVTPVGAEKMILWSKKNFAYPVDKVIGSNVVNWKCINIDIIKHSVKNNISTTKFESTSDFESLKKIKIE